MFNILFNDAQKCKTLTSRYLLRTAVRTGVGIAIPIRTLDVPTS